MNCAEAGMLFPCLLAKDLDPANSAALEVHLAACPSCQEEVTNLVELATRLDQLSSEQPSPVLRARFYRMLANASSETPPTPRWNWGLWAQAAMVLLFLGGGFLGGYMVWGHRSGEVQTQNQNFVLLHEDGPGLRMAGVMLASQGDPGDPAPADALLDLLDKDPSESVRLAAVDALYLFGRQSAVRDRLATSLSRQSSPRVQLALIDLLGGLREQRALDALKRLLQVPGTSPEVARRAQMQLKAASL